MVLERKGPPAPPLVVSFSPYLGVFKVVMVADSVCQKDLCKMLQFIGQGLDKRIPLSPTAPNVSDRDKIGRSLA